MNSRAMPRSPVMPNAWIAFGSVDWPSSPPSLCRAEIIESRPMSKLKRWRLLEIVRRSALAAHEDALHKSEKREKGSGSEGTEA